MESEAASLAMFVIQEAIKAEPAIAAVLRDLFNKADPTPEDWAATRARIASKSYRDYVPQSDLPQ